MARTPSVLIVDQNVDRRFQLKQMIHQSRFDVSGEVGYGAAAVSVALELKPDVIILAMEKLLARASQTLQSLLDALPETPVVVYSASEDLEVVREAMLGGARDFLVLPLKQAEVSKSIMAALESEERRR